LKPPDEYLKYFEQDNPKEGSLAVEPGWFQLWSPEEIESTNKGYEVEQNVPGFLGFGSNGGGEMLAFDQIGQIFMIPFVPMRVNEAKL